MKYQSALVYMGLQPSKLLIPAVSIDTALMALLILQSTGWRVGQLASISECPMRTLKVVLLSGEIGMTIRMQMERPCLSNLSRLLWRSFTTHVTVQQPHSSQLSHQRIWQSKSRTSHQLSKFLAIRITTLSSSTSKTVDLMRLNSLMLTQVEWISLSLRSLKQQVVLVGRITSHILRNSHWQLLMISISVSIMQSWQFGRRSAADTFTSIKLVLN